MKTIVILSNLLIIAVIIFNFTVNAQIKVINSNVGIGTSTPGEKLEIGGKLKMQNNILLNNNWLSNDGENEGIRIDNYGKVSIGAGSPKEKFQIGDRFTFHDGGTKVLGYNFYYDGQDKRIVDGKVVEIRFGDGDLSFVHADCDVPYIDEVDIAENSSYNSYNGYKMGTNVHLYNQIDPCSEGYPTTNNGQDINLSFLISSGFHKYALEWAPDRLIWYIDDAPVRTIYDETGNDVPQHAMAVILNFAIAPWEAFLPSDWNTFEHHNYPMSLPQYFEIDYLRYYKLNVDCNTDLTICTPGSDYSSRAVEKSITTGGSCSPTFNLSNNYTLRATDYVILDAGTTINADGAGFFEIQIMDCPQ